MNNFQSNTNHSFSKQLIFHNFSSEPFYGSPRSSTTSSSLSSLQRFVISVYSATTVFSNPERADALAALGEVTGHLALVTMHEKMKNDPTGIGQKILLEQPIIDNNSLDIESLLKPSSSSSSNLDNSEKKNEVITFGQVYAKFMQKHGFDPDGRADVKYISDPKLAYVMLRYRQCHDFWHALCDLPPTVLGEIALKWIELIQTGLPVAALSATVGSMRLNSEDRNILWNVYYPWAVQVGTQSTFLLNVYYEKELDEDIVVLRKRLGIIPAPKLDSV